MKTLELARAISTFVNGNGNDAMDELIGYIANDHRTLQQKFTKICVKWLEHMASRNDYEIDGRNQASRDMARKMVTNSDVAEQYGDEPSRYLPLI